MSTRAVDPKELRNCAPCTGEGQKTGQILGFAIREVLRAGVTLHGVLIPRAGSGSGLEPGPGRLLEAGGGAWVGW